MRKNRSICVDVDGVLAQYDGWNGVHNIGKPIPGAVEFCNNLYEEYNVIIHTTRANVEVNEKEIPEVPNTEAEKQRYLNNLLHEWLQTHGFKYDSIKPKPMAVGYIDDRACRCVPQRNGRSWDWYKAAWNELRLNGVKLPEYPSKVETLDNVYGQESLVK